MNKVGAFTDSRSQLQSQNEVVIKFTSLEKYSKGYHRQLAQVDDGFAHLARCCFHILVNA